MRKRLSLLLLLLLSLCISCHPHKESNNAISGARANKIENTNAIIGSEFSKSPYKTRTFLFINKYNSNFTSDEIEAIAKNYDLIIFGKGSLYVGHEEDYMHTLAKKIKKINPHTLVLFYINSHRSNIDASITKIALENHEDWFLHDKKTNKRIYSGASLHSAENLYAMDITNPSYRTGFSEFAKHIVEKYPYDGIFVDGALSLFNVQGKLWKQSDWFYPYIQNIQNNSNLKQISWQRVSFADPRGPGVWKEGLKTLLKETKNKIGNKLLIYNGIRRVPWGSGLNDIYLDCTDGILSEFMLFNCWRYNKCEKIEPDIIKLLNKMKKHHEKYYLLETKIDRCTPVKKRLQIVKFSYASYLLGKTKHSFYRPNMGHSNIKFGTLFDFNKLYPDIGQPVSNFYKAQGIYQRDYKKGKVLVNFDNTSHQVSLKNEYYLDNGRKIKSLTLGPETGELLTNYQPKKPSKVEIFDDFESDSSLKDWYNPSGYWYKHSGPVVESQNPKHIDLNITYSNKLNSHVGCFHFNPGVIKRKWSWYKNGIMKNVHYQLDSIPQLYDELQFKLRTNDDFRITVYVITTNKKIPYFHLVYCPKGKDFFDLSRLRKSGHAILLGMGKNVNDGKWHFLSLNLSSAVQKALPGEEITQIMNVRINTKAKLYIDDIKFQRN